MAEYIDADYLSGLFDVNDKDSPVETDAIESASRVFDRLVGVADNYFAVSPYDTETPPDVKAATAQIAIFILRESDPVTILSAGGQLSASRGVPAMAKEIAESWRLKIARELEAAALLAAAQNPLKIRSLQYF